MCMSPHEMPSAMIETVIAEFNVLVAQDEERGFTARANMYRGRVEGFEAILKERADDGTYDTAGAW